LKVDDPYTVTLERALEVIKEKQVADANRLITDFGIDDIQVLNGRYGPYITDKKKNARIPKDRDPKSLTLEDCRALLAAAPERGTGRFGRRKAATPAGAAAGTTAAAATTAEATPKPAKAKAKTKAAVVELAAVAPATPRARDKAAAPKATPAFKPRPAAKLAPKASPKVATKAKAAAKRASR
jgi:DNA topoisomerase I